MGQLRPSRADHARDAENFALSRLEADRLDPVPDDDVLRDDDNLADLLASSLWRIDVGEIASDHHGDELIAADLANQYGADQLAVLENGGAVGDLEGLVEAVGDEHNRHAALLEPANDREEKLDLMPAEHGRRLVEHDQLRVRIQGAGDLHHLPVSDRQPLHHLAEVDGRAEVV